MIGYSEQFTKLVSEACIRSLPNDPTDFESEYIRVTKIMGASLTDSFVIQGAVVSRAAEGTITRVVNPLIAAYGCPLDP